MITTAATLPQKPTAERYFGPPMKSASAFATFTGKVEVDEWTDITVVDAQPTTGKFGDQVVWSFTVDGQEELGTVIFYTSYSNYDGKGKQPEPSKLFTLYTALGVELPAAGEQLDKEAVVGKKCRAMFELREGKKFATITRIKARKEKE